MQTRVYFLFLTCLLELLIKISMVFDFMKILCRNNLLFPTIKNSQNPSGSSILQSTQRKIPLGSYGRP